MVAGLRSAEGASFAILEGVSSKFEINISVPLILEYEAVAKRQAREMGLTFEDIESVLDYFCSVGKHRLIYYLWRPVLRNPKDDLVLELAVEASVDYLITHNIRDFEGSEQFGIRIISPRDLLGVVRRDKGGKQ